MDSTSVSFVFPIKLQQKNHLSWSEHRKRAEKMDSNYFFSKLIQAHNDDHFPHQFR